MAARPGSRPSSFCPLVSTVEILFEEIEEGCSEKGRFKQIRHRQETLERMDQLTEKS